MSESWEGPRRVNTNHLLRLLKLFLLPSIRAAIEQFIDDCAMFLCFPYLHDGFIFNRIALEIPSGYLFVPIYRSKSISILCMWEMIKCATTLKHSSIQNPFNTL